LEPLIRFCRRAVVKARIPAGKGAADAPHDAILFDGAALAS
jgi:hypothetical protein